MLFSFLKDPELFELRFMIYVELSFNSCNYLAPIVLHTLLIKHNELQYKHSLDLHRFFVPN